MRQEVVELLQCPYCGGRLLRSRRTLRCRGGHSFDLARQGYVSLLPGNARAGTGDTPAMVAAREAFLHGGHYRPLAEAVADEAALLGDGSGSVIEIGAGTGYFLATTLDRVGAEVGLALDVSKHAARRAARAHPRVDAVVCDAWGALPVRSGTADVVLVVLAPRNAAEIRRLLRPSGGLVLVTPTPRHLLELVEPLGLLTVDERKSARLDEQLGPHLTLLGQRGCERMMTLAREDVAQLVTMGPSARHTDPASYAERVAGLSDPTSVTASFTVSVYRPRGSG